MIRPKRNSAGAVSLAKVAARVAVAAFLVLSFFASLLPLRAAAHAGAGTMACCVGKPGHCNSGLSARPRAKPKPKAEPLCGLKPAAANAEGEALDENEATTAADEISAEATSDEITILATSSAEDSAEDVNQRTIESPAAAESSPRAATTSLQSPSLTKPCPADCRAGTTGVVRQPRPREIAMLANGSRGTSPGQATLEPRSPATNLAASATLKRSRPRGPPPTIS